MCEYPRRCLAEEEDDNEIRAGEEGERKRTSTSSTLASWVGDTSVLLHIAADADVSSTLDPDDEASLGNARDNVGADCRRMPQCCSCYASMHADIAGVQMLQLLLLASLFVWVGKSRRRRMDAHFVSFPPTSIAYQS